MSASTIARFVLWLCVVPTVTQGQDIFLAGYAPPDDIVYGAPANPQSSGYDAPGMAIASEGPVLGPSCAGAAGCSSFYAQADGLFWHRVGAGCNQVLAIDTNLAPGQDTVLEANDLTFNLTGGVRFLVGWRPGCCSHCSAWELSYFGLYSGQATASATGDNSLSIPGDLGLNANNFLNADRISANYQYDLHNAEFNCVKTCCVCNDSIDFLAGFRFINLNERFALIGDDSADEGVGTYDVNANNYLYGPQLGGRYTRGWSCWALQLVGKGGVFLNQASQSQQVLDSPFTAGVPFQLRSPISASGNSVAGAGEIGVIAIRSISDTWSLRFGYTALGIGGLALAPDQLDFTDVAGVSGGNLNTGGWVFLHGGLLGVEAAW